MCCGSATVHSMQRGAGCVLWEDWRLYIRQLFWHNKNKVGADIIRPRLSKKPVIARRPKGPTWQSVPKSYDYQYIFGF